MNETFTFPFGRPATPRPPRRTSGQAALVVLGVYPSALHVRWTPPPWACSQLGIGPVGALAVDDEPTVFWDGLDASERIDKWRRDVGFRDGDGKADWGYVRAAFNGTSGRSVVERVLAPLGVEAKETWFTDAVDRFFIKSGSHPRQQTEVIAQDYAPFAAAVGLPPANLPARPPPEELVKLAVGENAERLRNELDRADAPLVVTLGEEARRVLLALVDDVGGPPTEPLEVRRLVGPIAATYGEAGPARINGRSFEWQAVVHPGQRSSAWAALHDAWIKRRQ